MTLGSALVGSLAAYADSDANAAVKVLLVPVEPVAAVKVVAVTPPTEDHSAATETAAAEPPGEALPVLSLGDAIAAALEHSPGLNALAWQSVAQWEQAASVSRYGGLSSEFSVLGMQTNSPLGVFGTKLSQGRVTQADFNPDTLNDPNFLGGIELKLKLMYPLFTSHRIELLADALRLNAEAVDYDRLAAQNDLTAKVIELYFAHDLLTQQQVVLEDAQQTVAELRRMIVSLESEGLVVKADIAAADVEVANIADELNRAQADLALTEQLLALLIGMPEGPFTSTIPLDAGALTPPELAEATAAALASRPDLLAMNKRVCAATNVLDEAIRKRNPTIGAFAEGKHATAGMPGDGHSEATLGAQLTLDLDSGGVIKHEIESKRAQLEAAQSGYDQLALLAQIDVAKAHGAMFKEQHSLQLFETQSVKAAENLRVVRNRYEEGLTNYLDLRFAVTELKASRLRKLNAHYAYLLAYMRLLTATGQIGSVDDPFFQLSAEPAAGVATTADVTATANEDGGPGNAEH